MSNIFNLTDTWNAGATTFTAIKMNVTDTASHAASLLMDLQVAASSKFQVAKDGTIVSVGDTVIGSAKGYYFGSRGSIGASADGVFILRNDAFSGFSRLGLGGTTSSFPAIKRSGTAVHFRLADDSAYAPIAAGTVLAADGDATTTAYGFSGEVGTGLYRASGNRLNVAVAGGLAATFFSTQLRLSDNVSLVFSEDGDTTLSKAAANVLGTPGSLILRSGTAPPAGGATTSFLQLGSTAGFGLYWGSGAPTVSAAQGSHYLRTDGAGVAERGYINTNGTTGWTAVATAT